MMYKTYCPITAEDTSATLHDKLAAQGATAICDVLESEETLQNIWQSVKFKMKANCLCTNW